MFVNILCSSIFFVGLFTNKISESLCNISSMEKILNSCACDFLKFRCKCLAFTRSAFRQHARSRFVSGTAFRPALRTVCGNQSEGSKQLHTPLASLFCDRTKVRS